MLVRRLAISLRCLNKSAMPLLINNILSRPFEAHQLIRQQYASFATLKQSQTDIDNGLFDDENAKWDVNYQQIIAEYPFSHISTKIVRKPSEYKMPENQKKDLIAFKSFSLRGDDLKKAAQYLLSSAEANDIEKVQDSRQGQQIFDLYYGGQVKDLIEMLNKGSGKIGEKVRALKILGYLSSSCLRQFKNVPLNQRTIIKQDQDGILIAHYIRYASRSGEDYTHLLPLLLQHLESKKSSPQSRVLIAKTIISTARFQSVYSQKIIQTAISQFIFSISSLHNYHILQSIRLLYNYHGNAARQYGRIIMQHLIKKHVGEGDIDFHVPLIVKTIKYCNKHRLGSQKLVEFVVKNISRFKVIFQKKQVSKGLLFSLIFDSQEGRINSQEILVYLKEFFFDSLQSFTTSQQIQQNDLIRISKLLIKYLPRLSSLQKLKIREQYLSYILPQFNHSNEVLCYGLLVVLREVEEVPTDPVKLAKYNKDKEFIREMVVKYLINCSQKVGEKRIYVNNINSIIEIMYQISRHGLNITEKQVPSLLDSSLSGRNEIRPEVVGYLFNYLNSVKGKDEQVIRLINQILPTLQIFFRKSLIRSLPTVFNILHVFQQVNFEHNFFYNLLEMAIANQFIKYPEFKMKESDIRFINNKLLKRGYGSRSLKQFVQGVLENTSNFAKCKQQYVSREKRFKQKLANKRNSSRRQ